MWYVVVGVELCAITDIASSKTSQLDLFHHLPSLTAYMHIENSIVNNTVLR